jgi:hypothetical protein
LVVVRSNIMQNLDESTADRKCYYLLLSERVLNNVNVEKGVVSEVGFPHKSTITTFLLKTAFGKIFT